MDIPIQYNRQSQDNLIGICNEKAADKYTIIYVICYDGIRKLYK